MQLTAGTMLGGRYRLDERIAGGGMGDVWRCTDSVLGRTVAVKVLLPALMEEPGFAERFRGEARTMATVNHPGVVDVYDYGSEGGTAFLVMEYVAGDALSTTLNRVGRLTPARTMALVAQAADALHAAHQKGIVHRDVKPGNLLVRPNGTLVLTDFGIARSAMVGQLTAVGSVLGTASYISPEQASGSGATPLSDVYALGVVAYQCLAGRRPFEGDNPIDIAMQHVRTPPPPLPGDIPPPVRHIVERSLAKDPAGRWPTAAALAQVARQAAGQLAPGRASMAGGAGLVTGTAGIHPTSGGGRPVSGGGPVSGAPASGAPMPPGGTRTMPPAAGRAAAAGGAPAMGSAAPRPPGGGAPPFAPSGYRGQPAAPQRRPAGLIAAATLLTILLLLMGVAYGVWYFRPLGDDPGSGQRESPAAAMVRIERCAEYKKLSRAKVKAELVELGFQVKEESVDAGGNKGSVVAVPCQAPAGSEVVIQVSSGKRGGQYAPPPPAGGQNNPKPSPARSPAAASAAPPPSTVASKSPSCEPGAITVPGLGACPPDGQP